MVLTLIPLTAAGNVPHLSRQSEITDSLVSELSESVCFANPCVELLAPRLQKKNMMIKSLFSLAGSQMPRLLLVEGEQSSNTGMRRWTEPQSRVRRSSDADRRYLDLVCLCWSR